LSNQFRIPSSCCRKALFATDSNGSAADLPLKHLVEIVKARRTDPPLAVLSRIAFVQQVRQVSLHKLRPAKFAMVMIIFGVCRFVAAAGQRDALEVAFLVSETPIAC
jgi:hypothetical protein